MSRTRPTRGRFTRRFLFGFLALAGAGSVSIFGTAAAQSLPRAEFRVTDKAVTAPVAPFTATVLEIGNGDSFFPAGGFEPFIFRTQLQAIGDGTDVIPVGRNEISGFDTWRDGAFDGAEVEVLRVEKGAFVSVRKDRIAPGGFRASGWKELVSGGVLPIQSRQYVYTWSNFNDGQRPYYFTVRAVDAKGRLSAPAEAFSTTRPRELKAKGQKPDLLKMKLDPSAAVSGDLPAPGGLGGEITPSGALKLTWDAVPGAVGYIPYVSDYSPEEHRGYAIALEGKGAPIRAGDLIQLRAKVLDTDPTRLLTNRVQGAWQFLKPILGLMRSSPNSPKGAPWELRPHEAGTPVTDAGETYLHADLSKTGALDIGGATISGTDQDFYEVLDPAQSYRLDVWLRGDPGTKAQLVIDGVGRNPVGTLPVSATWQRQTLDFRIPKLMGGKKAFQITLQLRGQGAVDVDNLRLYRADTPYLDLLPEDRTALAQSGMQALRTHGFVRTGNFTYDLASLTNPRGASRLRGGNTLPQVLENFASLGVDPWLQIEPHLSAEEWLGLAEYLAAPFDPAKDDPAKLPWAAKRVAQGDLEPWTDRFDTIYFEIGNETWNALFAPWIFPDMKDGSRSYDRGQVYGLYQEYVLGILRQSPWWDRIEPHLAPVLGGWGARAVYGEAAAKMSPQSRYLTVAAYNGGWDAGEEGVTETAEDFGAVMAFAVQSMGRSASSLAKSAGGASDGRMLSGTYEGGPGYVLNGLNGARVSAEQAAAQERVMKSAAAGAATLDSFLIRAREGDRLQNFFMYARGGYWSSHAPWYRGGQAWPSWDWLALFNRVGLGDMLDVTTLDVPLRDLPARGRRKAAEDAPMVGVYATRAGDRVTVAVISRLVPGASGVTGDGHSAVRVDLPFGAAKSLVRYSVPVDYARNNLEGPAVAIEAQAMTPPNGEGTLEIADLPPASAQIYVFEGVGAP